MLTPDQIERCIARWRRLYARGAVRWMPGMPLVDRVTGESCGFLSAGTAQRHERWLRVGDDSDTWDCLGACVPDFQHPATTGCLLAMAREATGDARLRVEWPAALQGNCYACGDSGYGEEDCEPAALLQAIEESTNAK